MAYFACSEYQLIILEGIRIDACRGVEGSRPQAEHGWDGTHTVQGCPQVCNHFYVIFSVFVNIGMHVLYPNANFMLLSKFTFCWWLRRTTLAHSRMSK